MAKPEQKYIEVSQEDFRKDPKIAFKYEKEGYQIAIINHEGKVSMVMGLLQGPPKRKDFNQWIGYSTKKTYPEGNKCPECKKELEEDGWEYYLCYFCGWTPALEIRKLKQKLKEKK